MKQVAVPKKNVAIWRFHCILLFRILAIVICVHSIAVQEGEKIICVFVYVKCYVLLPHIISAIEQVFYFWRRVIYGHVLRAKGLPFFCIQISSPNTTQPLSLFRHTHIVGTQTYYIYNIIHRTICKNANKSSEYNIK